MWTGDDDLGAAMAQSYSQGLAENAGALALDCLTIIGWLSDRVAYLEGLAGARPEAFPDLPSGIGRQMLKYQRDELRVATIRDVLNRLREKARA